jgi:hypothetical protein
MTDSRHARNVPVLFGLVTPASARQVALEINPRKWRPICSILNGSGSRRFDVREAPGASRMRETGFTKVRVINAGTPGHSNCDAWAGWSGSSNLRNRTPEVDHGLPC